MKNSEYFCSKALLITSILLLIPALVRSQGITTASVNGMVEDDSGQALAGANVVALHEPSGTTFGAASRSDGRFNIPGLRVGGPYTVTCSYIGYQTEIQEDIYLSLGTDIKITFVMTEQAIEFTEILSVAERNPIINASRTGAITNVSTAEIERLPTIARSFQDFTRLSPLFDAREDRGAYSAAGKNNRYNNVQIDGAVNNDLFGMAASGTPGGQAETEPISLDAIQEFQLVMAPFDVRQGGFTGAGVNATTRSGTNLVIGSVYFFGRNQELIGDGPEEAPFGDFDEFQTGFRVGGPLVKNKVFYFFNGEITRRNQPGDFVIDDSGTTNDFGGDVVSIADAQRFLDILTSYGYTEAAGFEARNRDRDSNKIFARVDINLATEHRLTLRHNFIDAHNDVDTSNPFRFNFPDNIYFFRNKTNSSVIQLNSVISSTMSNEARFVYQRIRDRRTGPTRFPQVSVDVSGPDLRAGRDQFSTLNALDQDIIEFTNDFTIFNGDHTITLGTHNEFFSFKNLFIGDSFGVYSFRSLDDFEAGMASSFDHSYSLSEDPEHAAEFDVYQLGFYVGDQWAVLPNLLLTLGVRADIPILPDDPTANLAVASTFGIRTDQTASGNLLWSPRLGFNWDVFNDATTQVRGGIGVFSGRTPYVWISNQYSNTGVEFARLQGRGSDVPTFEPDPDMQPRQLPSGATVTSEINVIDKSFKFPQLLRINAGLDRQLPIGFVGSIDFLYSKNINEILYRDLNLVAQSGTNPDDDRPVFGTPSRFGANEAFANPEGFTNVIFLTNTSLGYQWNLTAEVKRPLSKNLFTNLSYTYGRSKTINDGTASQAISNYSFNEIQGNPNEPTLASSDFDVRHRVLFNISYSKAFIPRAPTHISIFYSGREGRPYSTIYEGDVNGDGQAFNDLIYVPRNASEILLQDPSEWDALDAYIEGNPSLRDARGSIIERNASREPWTHSIDLRYAQNIPMPTLSGHQVQFTIDVLNFLNLLNSGWGKHERVSRFNTDNPLRLVGLEAGTNRPIFDFLRTPEADGSFQRFSTDIGALDSRWQIQFGLRYSF